MRPALIAALPPRRTSPFQAATACSTGSSSCRSVGLFILDFDLCASLFELIR
jgi:hypothetical protein